jgi:hypothetical protein
MLEYFDLPGVLLAILEKAEVIGPLYEENGMRLPKGTVAAGYQNFLICIEMFFAAVALKYAFPVNVRGCHLIKLHLIDTCKFS